MQLVVSVPGCILVYTVSDKFTLTGIQGCLPRIIHMRSAYIIKIEKYILIIIKLPVIKCRIRRNNLTVK